MWPAAPIFAGRHVTLRPLARADREGLLEAFSDGFAHSFATTVHNDATIDHWFDLIEAETAAGRTQAFTVLDADGRISGTTRFLRMNFTHKRVVIGGTLYAGRVRQTGVNTEAKAMLLAHAFEVLDVYCVQIRTDFLNAASRRAIERLGARLDGIMRGHMVLGEHRRDSAIYSILAHEWLGVKRRLAMLMDR